MFRKAIHAALAAFVMCLPNLPIASASTARVSAIEHAQLLGVLNLQGELFHVQGIDLDGQHIWVTSVDVRSQRGYLHEFDQATGKFLRRIELTDGARYHPGGFSISGNSIWIPVAEYRSHSSAVLEEIDLATLQIRRKIPVADHLGSAAVAGGRLVAGNWDNKQLYIFDLRAGGPVQVVPNPTRVRYQDMKFVGGQLVASGLSTWHSGEIDWIDFPSMKLVQTLRTGTADLVPSLDYVRPYTDEGMAMRGRDLYLLPDSGPNRLFHFRLDKAALSGEVARQEATGLARN